jgi:hypothetical protein
MSLSERRANLVRQINTISDEQTIEMLEEALGYYMHSDSRDITDGLSKYQLQELITLVEEPAEKDIISDEEFRKLFARWGIK